jgi:hypothetical protein
MKDLFGQEIIEDVLLRDKFIEPPFSVLDTRGGGWQNRKRQWLSKGIKSEVGRGENLLLEGNVTDYDFYRKEEKKKGFAKAMNNSEWVKEKRQNGADSILTKSQGTSVFDPALTELMYHWFCGDSGNILDPFAGGSVRGIVANYLGYKYTGIELREEQVNSNYEQARKILDVNNFPLWIIGDSDKILEQLQGEYDFIFSCPPYLNLEIYSDMPEDLSTMDFKTFMKKYDSIIDKSLKLLKRGCYACFVVGDVRDKNGYYYCFPDMTKMCFLNHGAKLYNEAVLMNVVGTASMRADKQFASGKKLVKIHQNVLIFKKL